MGRKKRSSKRSKSLALPPPRKSNDAAVQQMNVEAAVRKFDEWADGVYGKSEINVRSSYSLSAWVYSAISIITDWITQNPFRVVDRGRVLTGGPLFNLVENPNNYEQQNSSVKWRTAYMTELLLSGAVMRVLVDLDGIRPRKMVAMPRGAFFPETYYDELGLRKARTWRKYGYSSKVFIPGDTIHHDALYNPFDELEGLPPLTASLLGINADVNLSQLLSRFFSNDASTGLIMATDKDLSGTQLTEAKEAWDAMHRGVSRAFSTKFIGWGFRPYPIGTTFDATVQRILSVLTRDAIMNAIFKIPPVIYAGEMPAEGVTIGSRSSQPEREAFLLHVIMLWSSRYDAEFNRDVAPRFGAGVRGFHDFSEHPILQTRRLERAAAAVELIDRGLTLNQVITWLKLELDPEPHGNEFWVPSGGLPASWIMSDQYRNSVKSNQDANVDSYIADIIKMAETSAVKNDARSGTRPPATSPGRNGNIRRIQEMLGDAAEQVTNLGSV